MVPNCCFGKKGVKVYSESCFVAYPDRNMYKIPKSMRCKKIEKIYAKEK